MNRIEKSHFKTALEMLRAPALLVLLPLVVAVIAFQNCAPEMMGEINDGSDPNHVEMKKLEDQIMDRNNALESLVMSNLSCSTDTDCTTVAVGSKACGGPRAYVTTSTANDLEQIQSVSTELASLEQQYGARKGLISNCLMVEPPLVRCVSNTCRIPTP